MAKASFTREMSAASLAKPVSADSDLSSDRSIRIDRADAERLDGKVRRSGLAIQGETRAPSLSRRLDRRLKTRTPSGFGVGGAPGDRRQQAVVKIHYFQHAGGRGGGLASHAAYVSRDGAAREDDLDPAIAAERHAEYLTRDGAKGREVFYAADKDRLDGRSIAVDWATSDKRHFQIVLAAEEGGAIRDLPSYTREVMTRAEATLGKPLQWIAVDPTRALAARANV